MCLPAKGLSQLDLLIVYNRQGEGKRVIKLSPEYLVPLTSQVYATLLIADGPREGATVQMGWGITRELWNMT